MEYGGGKTPKTSGDDSGLVSGDANFALKTANIYYMCLFVVMGIFCFILYNTGYSWLGKVISTVYKDKSSIGVSLVARTCSALFLWYILHALITICNPNLVDSAQFIFHVKWLWLHTLVFIGIWIGFWFIPDGFFDFWMQFSIYVSVLYLIAQIFFLIDWFHKINDKWVEEEKMCYLYTGTIVLSLATIIAAGVSYYIFGGDSCTRNYVILSINLAISVIFLLIPFLWDHVSIFTSSMVSIYIIYLTIAGMMCNSSGCNRISTGSQGIGFSIVASLFTLAWCGYSAFSSTSQLDACDCGCCTNEETGESRQFSLSFFHLLYALASVYLTMIVTHWGKAGSEAAWTTARGSIAMWVNFGSSWFVALLYMWVCIAPKVLTDREFA